MLQAQCTTSCPNAVRPRQFAFVEGIFTQYFPPPSTYFGWHFHVLQSARRVRLNEV